MALVDKSSFFVQGFFRANVVDRIQPGMPAVVTLMTYSQRPLIGEVEGIGWGIYQDDGASGPDLLPKIRPTFEWIRLAQRVPVGVCLGEIPDDLALRVGTTASVLVMTGGRDPDDTPSVPAPLR
jgi:multidrug resistance efflux pump